MEKENSKYKFQGTGLPTAERNFAKKRFEEYQNNYHLDSYSDLQLLEDLVYREAIEQRYKKKIKELDSNKKVEEIGTILPKHILEALNDNSNRILILKEKLGLFKEKTEDEYKAFETLEKKMEIYKDEHIEEFDVDCPFCGIKFFLNRRIDGYQPSKLKLFKNKVLCNLTLWRMYKEKKFTKEEFAEILNVSPNYIDWLEEKIYKNPSK